MSAFKAFVGREFKIGNASSVSMAVVNGVERVE